MDTKVGLDGGLLYVNQPAHKFPQYPEVSRTLRLSRFTSSETEPRAEDPSLSLFTMNYFRAGNLKKYVRSHDDQTSYAMITGATDGIGAALASELAASGFNLIIRVGEGGAGSGSTAAHWPHRMQGWGIWMLPNVVTERVMAGWLKPLVGKVERKW
jgi:hypothetical protein